MESFYTASEVVIRDLFRFVFVEHFGWSELHHTAQLPLSFSNISRVHDATTADLSSVHHVVPIRGTLTTLAPGVCMYQEPAAYFDGVIATLPSGVTLSCIERSERWYHVIYEDCTGWVLSDDVVEGVAHPQFLIGASYGSEATETRMVRAHIHDEFSGGRTDRVLQDVEYVYYRLLQQGKHIAWPMKRPRIAGSWQHLLKGGSGIHMTVLPQVGSVMETVFDDGTGHVAFVEQVYSDESIMISEVGFPEEGSYNERVLPREEWREYRPIFIECA